MSAADLTPVRFTKAHGIYNSGEVAGFTRDRAAELVAQGVAVPMDADPVAEPALVVDPALVDAAAPAKTKRQA